eukprot:CAMPEP_0179011622 /NCGR_PEP_ID=MMETSP0796-20121207/764_1 /TAXON_ID=73915 /ORGANISM="Pyrodinium bahamense, Strain pbaha01" /LENGTH=195 /DNA_ID=CAMNT_0020707017 /DNA_START=276 /DNA_END=863 /DNA_ORIENTATION=-
MVKVANMFDSMALEALPIHHRVTLRVLRRAYDVYKHTVFMVPNWYFGNGHVDLLQCKGNCVPGDGLFLPSTHEAHNVVRANMNDASNLDMVSHGLRCLDHLVDIMPNLKLIFWCIARRTLIPDYRSSVPSAGQYLEAVSRYRANTLDVLDYHPDQQTFTSCFMKDKSGHPKRKGYELIMRMLSSSSLPNGEVGMS